MAASHPEASLFSLVGCDASGWDAMPSSPLFAPPTHAGGRRSACVDALAVRVWAPQVGLRSLVYILYGRTDFDQGAGGLKMYTSLRGLGFASDCECWVCMAIMVCGPRE